MQQAWHENINVEFYVIGLCSYMGRYIHVYCCGFDKSLMCIYDLLEMNISSNLRFFAYCYEKSILTKQSNDNIFKSFMYNLNILKYLSYFFMKIVFILYPILILYIPRLYRFVQM